MLSRLLIFVSIVVVVCAVVMVMLAAKNPEGLASALGIWGFVLSVVGIVLGVAGLQTAKPTSDPVPGVQVIHAQQGDAFGVQNGTMNVDRRSSPEAKLSDN
ncbi:hypothetical protein ACX80J_14730 [Arthrobacter sp. MDB2-24]